MKINKPILIFLAVVLGYYGFSAWGQYTWSERFQKGAATDNWIVFDEQRNTADFLYPYTFFVKPVSRLGFIQKNSIVQLETDIYGYTLMWADGPLSSSTKDETFLAFSDCKNGLSGSLKEGINKFSSMDDIEWSRPDDNPYARNDDIKQKLVESFQNKCAILSKFK